MTTGLIDAIVDNLNIVDTIGHKISECLVVGFSRKLILAIFHFETIVKSSNKVYGTLTLYLAVEGGIRYAIDCVCITQLFEKRSLVVQSCCYSESNVMIVCRHNAQRHSRANYTFPVETPVRETNTIVQSEKSMLPSTGELVRVLYIGFGSSRFESVFCIECVDHIQVITGVWYYIASRITHLIFSAVFLNQFPSVSYSNFKIMMSVVTVKYGFYTLYIGC